MTVLQVLGTVARDVQWIDGRVPQVVGSVVKAGDQPAIGSGVNDFRIPGIRCDVAALAATDHVPVLPADDAIVITARDRNGGIVLLRAIDAVRPVIVDGHVIELRGRLIVRLGPRPAAVERHARAAVTAVDHVARIARIDPQPVVIAVR